MNGASGFQEVRPSTPDHHGLVSCTSNGIDSETVPDTIAAPKSTPFRFAWLLMTVIASFGLASCVHTGSFSLWREDTIHFTTDNTYYYPPIRSPRGPIKRLYGALIDGERDKQCLNDYKQKPVDSNEDMYIGNFRSSPAGGGVAAYFSVPGYLGLACLVEGPGEIIGFTRGYPPTILDVAWTPRSDYVDLHFQKTYTFPVKVWIVSGDSHDQKGRAALALLMTETIWHNERQGFAFSSVTFDDTKKDDDFASFTCDSFDNADETNWITHNRIEPKMVNIYYVDKVIGQRNGGYEPENGFNCYAKGYRNVIVMGSNTAPALLAHEFGHAFGINHVGSFTEFDETNVMHEASDFRTFLTEGQTFRQTILPYSAVNDTTSTRKS
jgi:Metallo-peptidase family M12B Reprolysin-like